jgi:DNA-directed RNA polymerase subunit RPC12/RpoP
MGRSRTYRCLNCLEETVTRSFDTSHLSRRCPDCGSMERFVNEAVYEQFKSFEAAPPAALEWDQLSRTERLLVSERVVRTDRSVEDFDIAT